MTKASLRGTRVTRWPNDAQGPLNVALLYQRNAVGGSGIKHQAALFRTQEARWRLGMFAPRPDAA